MAQRGRAPRRFGADDDVVRLPSRGRQAGHRDRCSESYSPRQGPRGGAALARLVGRVPSAELTPLMREAQTANLDIAVAIAQILQADAQVRITGAGLLPLIDYNASDHGHQDVAAARHRGRQHPRRRRRGVAVFAALRDLAERELHRRLLGQEPGDPQGGGRNRGGEPVQHGGGDADRARLGRQHLLPGPGGAGSPAHRAPQSHRCDAHPRPHQAAVRRRHFLRPQRRAAGEPRRAGARVDPDLRAAAAAEHRGARRAGRAHAGTLLGEGQFAHRHHDAADNAGLAVVDPVPAAGRAAGRIPAEIVDLQRRVGPRRLLPDHPAHRHARLPERGAADVARAGGLVLHGGGEPHPADLRRRRADGAARTAEGPAGPISADLPQNGALRPSPTSSRR